MFSFTTYAYASEISLKISFSATIQIISRPKTSDSSSTGVSGHSFLVINNCSYFAKTVWNSVNSSYKVSGTDSFTLANSIKKLDGYVTNPTIPSKSKNDIAIHTSNGVNYLYRNKSLVPNLYSTTINSFYETESKKIMIF